MNFVDETVYALKRAVVRVSRAAETVLAMDLADAGAIARSPSWMKQRLGCSLRGEEREVAKMNLVHRPEVKSSEEAGSAREWERWWMTVGLVPCR